jgi:pimeloyl-ACP methyl ester carboxylesterase
MAALIPNATLTIIPDAGHMTPLEQPGAVTALLRDLLARS